MEAFPRSVEYNRTVIKHFPLLTDIDELKAVEWFADKRQNEGSMIAHLNIPCWNLENLKCIFPSY